MRQVESSPLVSIGFPVYDGEEYISQALDSLLAQTHTNFELIISDNVSTDGTWGLCQRYAVKDTRIQLYQNEENLGAGYNFKRVLDLSSGNYFMWASHDDVWDKDFISELLSLLKITESAVLAACRTEKIAYDNTPIKFGPKFLNTINMSRAERLNYFTKHNTSWMFYGLYKIEIPRSAFHILGDKRLEKCAGDVLFMRKCIDYGDLVFNDNVLHYKRATSQKTHEEFLQFNSLTVELRNLFWHFYTAIFSCYNFDNLNYQEKKQIYISIFKGVNKLSFYHHLMKTLSETKLNRLRKYILSLFAN